VVKVEVHLSGKSLSSTRETPQIIDVFGMIGGIQDVLIIVFGLVVAPIAGILFTIQNLKMGRDQYKAESLTDKDLYIS
jgi:hypothetical protein